LEERIYATFFLRQDEADYAQLMTRLIHAAEMPYYAALDEIEAVEHILENFSLHRYLTDMSIPHAVTQFSRVAELQTEVDLARVGLLIELHHAEHGVYPEHLSALAPELGGAVPVDPFTGQPYRYRPEEDGFTLYSLGSNIQDNGGRHDHSDGDIVWRGVAQLPLQSIVRPPQLTVRLD